MVRWTLWAAFLVVAALAFGGCGDANDEGDSPPGSSGPVPDEMNSVEEAAEDSIDMVFTGNWDKVAADADSIEEDWQAFLSSEGAGGVSDAQKQDMANAIEALRLAADLRDGIDARQAANNVSEVAIDVFDLFQVRIPTDVGRLDYLERQVIIDAELKDWDGVVADVQRVKETFERVRGDVDAAGGSAETDTFEESVNKQERLAAAHDVSVADEANLALELVDALESVY
jgi:hypothetical protein